MTYSDTSKRRRMTAGILGILMLFIMLLSAFYIAAEADHDCTGEDCPVCACIQQCGNTLHPLSEGKVVQTAVVIPVVFIYAAAAVITTEFPGETLASRKIRLNN